MNEQKAANVKRAKFIKGWDDVKGRVELTFGVSVENEKQKGSDLDAFVVMVNRNSAYISKLFVLVGAYLHRHYVGEEAAIKMYNDWVGETKHNFEKLKVSYEIVNWKEVISTEQFKEDLIFVKKLYEEDSEFKTKVNNISKAHLNKADIETVKEYLLEECAFFKARKGYFTYPILRLNAACEYVIEKYNNDFNFKSYVLNTSKENSITYFSHVPKPPNLPPGSSPSWATQRNGFYKNQNISPDTKAEEPFDPQYLLVCCAEFSLLMTQCGLRNKDQQLSFFKQYLEQTQKLTSMIPSSGKRVYEEEKNSSSKNNY